MTTTFLLTIDADSTDPNSLSNLADDLRAILDPHFDVIDLKPWARHNAVPPTAPLSVAPIAPPSGV